MDRGRFSIRRLPAHFAISVHALLLHSSADGGPSNNINDYEPHGIKSHEDNEIWPIHFALRKPAGFYHVGFSVIAFMKREGKTYAQVERFLTTLRPHHTAERDLNRIQFCVDWPDVPTKKLGTYGTIRPQSPGGK